MKLIIDIPEVDYECAKQRWMRGISAYKMDYYISNGIPFDFVINDIKAEILSYKDSVDKAISDDEFKRDGMKVAYQDCLEIIDKHIGKVEKGGE